jgi:hypothetical protein
MSTPNFDLLDAGTFGDSKRGIDPADIPSKVTDLVKRMSETGQPFTVPTDNPEYKDQMRPYFAAAAELLGREARVWDVKDDDDRLIGFRVSLGKGRRKSHKSSTGDAPVGAE